MALRASLIIQVTFLEAIYNSAFVYFLHNLLLLIKDVNASIPSNGNHSDIFFIIVTVVGSNDTPLHAINRHQYNTLIRLKWTFNIKP